MINFALCCLCPVLLITCDEFGDWVLVPFFDYDDDVDNDDDEPYKIPRGFI